MGTEVNGFEGGALGATITVANSAAGGQAFDFVTTLGGVTYTDQTIQGASAALLATTTSAMRYVQWTGTRIGASTLAGSPALYARCYCCLPALPPAGGTRIALVTNTSDGFVAEWRISATGQLEVRNAGTVLLATSAAAVSAGQWFRAEFAIPVFSATVGQIAGRLFLAPNAAAPTESLTSSANQNTASTTTAKVWFGIARSLASFSTLIDGCGWSTDGWLGPGMVPSSSTSTSGTSRASTPAATGRTSTPTVSAGDTSTSTVTRR